MHNQSKNIDYPVLILTFIPLGLWLFSLTQTVFANWVGYEILSFGWAGLIVFCPAWFANIFFIIVLFLIWRKIYTNTQKQSTVFLYSSAYLMLLLSLTTYYYNGVSGEFTNSGVGRIHGYGWGAIVWFGAIFSLLLITGFFLYRSKKIHAIILMFIGGIAIIWQFIFVSNALIALSEASTWQQEQLAQKNLIIKQGLLCTHQIDIPQKIEKFNHIIRVSYPDRAQEKHPRTFYDSTDLNVFVLNTFLIYPLYFDAVDYDNQRYVFLKKGLGQERYSLTQNQRLDATAELVFTIKYKEDLSSAELHLTIIDLIQQKTIFNNFWNITVSIRNGKEEIKYDDCAYPDMKSILSSVFEERSESTLANANQKSTHERQISYIQTRITENNDPIWQRYPDPLAQNIGCPSNIGFNFSHDKLDRRKTYATLSYGNILNRPGIVGDLIWQMVVYPLVTKKL